MFAAGYLASLIMGITLGMLGGGGSILTVPILVYLFSVPPVIATSYSLFVVGMTSIIGTAIYFRRGDTDFKTGGVLAIPSAIGVNISRLYILPHLPQILFKSSVFLLTKDILIMLAFATIMLVAAISMIKKKKQAVQSGDFHPHMYAIAAQGLLLGMIAGFVGAGGGFLLIPALVMLAGLSMRKAVGTSLMIIAFQSLTGFFSEVLSGAIIDWNLLLGTAAVASVGIAIGSFVAKKFNEQTLKKSFGFFVLIMGAAIFIEQLFHIAGNSL